MGKWGESKTRIVELLADRPNLHDHEIAAALGLARCTVNLHLIELRDMGVLRVNRRPRWAVARDRGVPVIRRAGSV